MRPLLLDGQPFTTTQARRAGLSPDRLDELVLRGEAVRVLRGVLLDARVPVDLAVRASALALVAPPDTVVAGTTAAWLLGVPALLPGADRLPPVLEVVRPAGRSALRRSGVVARVAVLGDDEVVDLGGVPVTAPTRTALDLARGLDRSDGLAYLDAMLGARLVEREALEQGLEGLAGFPWVDQARELVALADPRAESPGESWMRLRWHDAGLPPLELQVEVQVGDAVVARLDTALRERGFALEYDGERWHGPEREAHDAHRRDRLRRVHGWTVLAVGKEAVLGRSDAFERAVAGAVDLVPEVVPWQRRRRTTLRDRRVRLRRAAEAREALGAASPTGDLHDRGRGAA
ncbi:type IV toxin-antitoxin system AbiEi family antitoxin [Vallicoccus soli]|uniref:Uncharacterized protein n=1 Tax=Vallicoccus soli TaxID=2339232 RepID=A0A3A3YYG6_9ACTN|nr:type IV toxin-antitoxin system AbiEi family antitoxin [Vallicoccus soli]RJK96790.1 hypothetical protein D5H78_05830 [Vallicoccus soli]